MSKTKKSLLCLLVLTMLITAICCFAGCKNKTADCDKNGHNWQKVYEVAPTCEVGGTKEHYKCSVCGKTALFDGKEYTLAEAESLAIPSGHSWGDEIQTISATCESAGVKAHYECSACHKLAVYENGGFAIKTEAELTIGKTDHSWGSLIEGTPAVCDKDGIAAHYECSVCGAKAVKEGGEYVIKTDGELAIAASGAHTWGELIGEKAATCGETGVKEHYECSICGTKAVKEGGEYVIKTDAELAIAASGAHTWGEFIAEKAATCAETGVKGHYECSVCGFKAVKEGETYVVKTDGELVIPTVEHTWGAEIPSVEATCDADGVKAHYECSVCGAKAVKEGDEYVIKTDGELAIAAAHKWAVLNNAVSATCTADGRKAYMQCEVCGVYAECDAAGNVVAVTDDYGSLTVPRGHRFAFNSERNAYVCGDCGTTLAARDGANVNLNVHDDGGDYVSDDKTVVLNVEDFGLKAITKISVDGLEVSEYDFADGVLTVPYSAFATESGRYPYGEKKISVTGITGREYETTIDYPVLFITKILKTEKDLQDFGKIAWLQENNSGKSSNKEYSYGGYFELGADINANGKRYTMVASASRQVSSSVGGFKGVFDGKGYSIKNLLIGGEKVWYSGWDDTEDNVYKVYSFIGRLDGGTIKNVNFTGVKLNPISSVICSSGYGEIANIYAQIARCAIIKDKDASTGELKAYMPLGFSFSQGVSDPAGTSIHEVIVDFSGCEYCALDKGVRASANSDLAVYDYAYGFIDDENIYNVFGKNATKTVNCFVIAYPGSARAGETIYSSFGAMDISATVAAKFNGDMFALKDGMLLPKKYAEAYAALSNGFTVSVSESKISKGGKVKVDIGGLEQIAEFVSDGDGITYSNGYVYFDESLSGNVSFGFKIKNKTSEKVTVTIMDEGDFVDSEIAEWVESGLEDLGSALNSSVAVEKLGNQNVYKTTGGWNVNIANADIDAANYKEFRFLYKTSVEVNLGSSSNKNKNKANVWYYVKLVKNLDDSWSIYAKTLDDADYTPLEASSEYFASGKSFTDMFKTWVWQSSGYDVYATNVYGVASLPYENVEKRIEALPETVSTVDEINRALEVFDAYANLSDEQKSLIASERVAKLNAIVQSVFANETSSYEAAGATKTKDSAVGNSTYSAVLDSTVGSYGVYKSANLPGNTASRIGAAFYMNDYNEIYFAYKSTASVAIFSGSNSPALSANKWYSIKLVKGEANWTVWKKAFGETDYTQIDLGTTVISSTSNETWFHSVFMTARWNTAADVYDVYTVGLWLKGAGEYESIEKTINALPETASTIDEINNVFAAESAYNALPAEQKAKVSAESVQKLNELLGSIFANEISSYEAAGATKTQNSALKSASVKSGTVGSCDIYTLSGLTGWNNAIGVGININNSESNFSTLYFAFKVTASVTIFDGSNTPALSANKWYSIKLVKGEANWTVWAKAFGEEGYEEIVLGNYGDLSVSGDKWFNTAFKAVDLSGKVSTYDVYATGLWAE